MSKVKIVSGWSNPGGSTIHHIGLTNLLNQNGLPLDDITPKEMVEDLKTLQKLRGKHKKKAQIV